MKTRDGTLCGLQAMGSSKLPPHPPPPPPPPGAGKVFPPIAPRARPKKEISSEQKEVHRVSYSRLALGGWWDKGERRTKKSNFRDRHRRSREIGQIAMYSERETGKLFISVFPFFWRQRNVEKILPGGGGGGLSNV